MVAKRKQPTKPKVIINFTPVEDWDYRLKRVMELLLYHAGAEKENHTKRGDGNDKRRRQSTT